MCDLCGEGTIRGDGVLAHNEAGRALEIKMGKRKESSLTGEEIAGTSTRGSKKLPGRKWLKKERAFSLCQEEAGIGVRRRRLLGGIRENHSSIKDSYREGAKRTPMSELPPHPKVCDMKR